jgi:hypothetical protein
VIQLDPFTNLYDLLVLSTKDKGFDLNVLVVCSKERKVVKKKRTLNAR